MKKIKYLIKLVWQEHRKLLGVSSILIPILVFLPYIQIYLSKLIVEVVGQRYPVRVFFLIGVLIWLIRLTLTTVKEFGLSFMKRDSNCLVHTLLKQVDKKTMNIDYRYVEGLVGQQCRQKALSATYQIGGKLIPLIIYFVADMLGLVLYGTMVGACDPILLVVIFFTVLAAYGLNICRNKYESTYREKIVEWDHKLQYLEGESLSLRAAREIRIYDMVEMICNLFNQAFKQRNRVLDRIERVKLWVQIGVSTLSFFRNVFAYVYLVYLTYVEQISMSDFILMTGILANLSGRLGGVMDDLAQLRQISIYMDDFFSYVMLEEEEVKRKKLKFENAPCIEFKQVCFRYEGTDEDILKDINLKISSGERIAIVGKNGAGKTTLVKLICGLYKPTSGSIYLDGKDISNYDRMTYFNMLSAVFQEVMLLPVSIASNVSSKIDEDSDEIRICQSLKLAGMYDTVKQMPKGIMTPMQRSARQDAIELSGGEQQKIMLAKAIYKKACVLLLDEPTAALDSIAESAIYKKYNELTKDMTSCFISHRLASTSFCDKILFLEEGKVLEEGSHDELMKKRGAYYQLFMVQSHYYVEGEEMV